MVELIPYAEYKDSSVSWLGDVPGHWEVRRLRNLAEMRVSNVDKHVKEGEAPIRLCNYVDVYKNDFIHAQMDFMKATATLKEIEYFRLEKGDILITKDSEAWDDIGVPALVTNPARDLISGYHLALLRSHSDKLVSGYLFRTLQSKGLAYQFHIEAKGVTRYGLSHSGTKSVWVPLPPLPEQAAIVRYLDYVERRVRRFVRAKQKLIGLLEEQKQVIVHRAVTRGLDSDVPLKPSGVRWLGEVPEHWDVRKLKILSSRMQNGATPPTEEPSYYAEGGLPWYGPPSLGNAITVGQPTRYLSDRAIEEGKARLIAPPALAVSVIGNIGRCALLLQRGATNQQITCFELISSLCNPHFIVIQFRFAEQSLRASASSATISILDSIVLKATTLALPPLPEQTAIVEYLDKATADIDAAITRARREIELLNEYRTRLIADVVTGKLDVREAAAQLPAESDESESFNESDSPAGELDTPLVKAGGMTAPGDQSRGEVVLYQAPDGTVELDVRLERESLWLSINQMASLFERDKSVISRHLGKVFKEGELDREATVAKNATIQIEGSRRVTRGVDYFNLDAIISVGYRVNSKRGTQFRVWATGVLRDHIIKGYSVNRNRLRELQQTVRLITNTAAQNDLSGDEARALLQLVGKYSRALNLLDDYDHQRLEAPEPTGEVIHILSYEEALRIVKQLRQRFRGSTVFGVEKDKGLASALGAIMQTAGGKDVYPSIEEKAAHLLYFFVKDHAFIDGNKRIAVALFLWFLERNRILTNASGEHIISNAALVALTLMIAKSQPREKDVLVRIVTHLLCDRSRA